MRIQISSELQFARQSGPTLTYRGPAGEHFSLDILDHDLIRVWHCPDGTPRLDRTWMVVGADGETPRAGRSRADRSPFPCPPYRAELDGPVQHIATEKLTITVHTGRLALAWSDALGRPFASDLLPHAYPYDARGQTVWHYLQRRPGEHYYGFGEKAGPLDKHGLRLRMCNTDALGYNAEIGDPLYKHWPFYITYVPELKLAYGLFYDNLAATSFELGKEVNGLWGQYRYYEAAGGDLDYYLIYGPTIPAVIEKFTRLTGRPLLPPRWSLGYLGSTMAYTERPDAQAALDEFIAHCAEHAIPCDGFHLSSGYTTDPQGRRQVFTWNTSRIPEPARMVDSFHRAGIHLAANIKPHLLRSHPRFEEVRTRGGFIQAADGQVPEMGERWSGGIAQSEPAAYLDFTNPAGYDWWVQSATEALLDYGIDALWNDNNEFEVWDDEAICAGFGQPIPARLARPLQTLLMGRASHEALRRKHPMRRPLVLTRAACPGLQRYAQTWSGDNTSSWHTLRWNLPMGLGLSLSGMPNTGHDVGGFFGDPPDPELFVRWVEAGVFQPRFSIHSVGLTGLATEPWMYPEVLPIVRDWIRFRYRLIPYLYTLLFESTRSGQPITRPLVYAFPDDPRCQTESFELLLGPGLLVAPVTEPGARRWPVYLPAGTDWCDFYSGEWHAGGQEIEVAAPLERIPLFASAGALIPTGKPMRHVGAEPDDVREVLAFPHPEAGSGMFTLIEDDGISANLDYTKVKLRMDATPNAIQLAIEVDGTYPLPYREIVFVLPPGEARSVTSPSGSETRDSEGRRRIAIRLL